MTRPAPPLSTSRVLQWPLGEARGRQSRCEKRSGVRPVPADSAAEAASRRVPSELGRRRASGSYDLAQILSLRKAATGPNTLRYRPRRQALSFPRPSPFRSPGVRLVACTLPEGLARRGLSQTERTGPCLASFLPVGSEGRRARPSVPQAPRLPLLPALQRLHAGGPLIRTWPRPPAAYLGSRTSRCTRSRTVISSADGVLACPSALSLAAALRWLLLPTVAIESRWRPSGSSATPSGMRPRALSRGCPFAAGFAQPVGRLIHRRGYAEAPCESQRRAASPPRTLPCSRCFLRPSTGREVARSRCMAPLDTSTLARPPLGLSPSLLDESRRYVFIAVLLLHGVGVVRGHVKHDALLRACRVQHQHIVYHREGHAGSESRRVRFGAGRRIPRRAQNQHVGQAHPLSVDPIQVRQRRARLTGSRHELQAVIKTIEGQQTDLARLQGRRSMQA
eukprot:scaffold2875_cov247-Pinguiococcus_pyrenoidosus.AAC.8